MEKLLSFGATDLLRGEFLNYDHHGCCKDNLLENDGNTIERKGFVIGIGIGGKVISIADSNDEVQFDEAQFGISLPNLKVWQWIYSHFMKLTRNFGYAVAVNAGYEFVQKKRFALDLQTKLHIGRVY